MKSLQKVIKDSEKIQFDEKNHTYTFDNIKASYSVTQFIKLFFFEFDADSVIDRMMRSKTWTESIFWYD